MIPKNKIIRTQAIFVLPSFSWLAQSTSIHTQKAIPAISTGRKSALPMSASINGFIVEPFVTRCQWTLWINKLLLWVERVLVPLLQPECLVTGDARAYHLR